MDIERYNKIADKLQEKIDKGILTEETANLVNVEAYKKYVDPTFTLEDALAMEATPVNKVPTASTALGQPAQPAAQTVTSPAPAPAPAAPAPQGQMLPPVAGPTQKPNTVNQIGKTISTNIANNSQKAASEFVKKTLDTPVQQDSPVNDAKAVRQAEAMKSQQLNSLQKEYDAKKKEIQSQQPVSNE